MSSFVCDVARDVYMSTTLDWTNSSSVPSSIQSASETNTLEDGRTCGRGAREERQAHSLSVVSKQQVAREGKRNVQASHKKHAVAQNGGILAALAHALFRRQNDGVDEVHKSGVAQKQGIRAEINRTIVIEGLDRVMHEAYNGADDEDTGVSLVC